MTGLVLALLLAAAGFFLIWRFAVSRTNLGSASVQASDMTADGKVLYSNNFGIYGKPDYIVKERHRGKEVLVAVEVKPTRRSRSLYEGDRLQAVAYGLLVQENYPGKGASYARVSYAPGISFKVDLSGSAINSLTDARSEILASRRSAVANRSHDQRARCLGCGFRSSCSQSLV